MGREIMNQEKQFVSLLDPRISKVMWRGSHTLEYLRSFLCSYFKEKEKINVEEFEILNEEEIGTNYTQGIHISFSNHHEKYYYEVKFTDEKNVSKYFDFTFLKFAKYCWSLHLSNIHIGQIMIDFQNKELTQPIFSYTMKNNQIKEDEGIEIHVLSIPMLSKIIQSRKKAKHTLFEQWVLLFAQSLDEEELEENEVLKLFHYLWHQESNKILLEEFNKSEQLQLSFILSHLEGKPIEEKALYLLKLEFSKKQICKATGLSIQDLEKLQLKITEEKS